MPTETLPFKRYVVKVSMDNVPSIREITIVKLTPTGMWKRDNGDLVRHKWAWQESEAAAWEVFCKEKQRGLDSAKDTVARLETVLARAAQVLAETLGGGE